MAFPDREKPLFHGQIYNQIPGVEPIIPIGVDLGGATSTFIPTAYRINTEVPLETIVQGTGSGGSYDLTSVGSGYLADVLGITPSPSSTDIFSFSSTTVDVSPGTSGESLDITLDGTSDGQDHVLATTTTAVASTTYTYSVNAMDATAPTATPTAGTYSSPQSVTLTASNVSSTIYYTTDGTTPTCSTGMVYSSPISVNSSETVNAISCYATSTPSDVASFAYTINVPASSGGVAVASGGGGGGGGYYNPYTVTIDGDASQTASANVTLGLTTVAGMNRMWISNDSTFATSTGTGWIPFQSTYPWTLSSTLGDQAVYAEFGNASTTAPAGTAEASINLTGEGVVLGASTTNFVALEQQLQNLDQQLLTLEFKVNSCSFVFNKNLSKGMTSPDVKNLQMVLNYAPLTQVAETGAGSPNDESTYFGNATKNAVIAFQNIFANQILAPNGLTSSTGYVGSATRAVLNGLCGQ